MATPRKNLELSKRMGTAQAQRVLGRDTVKPGAEPKPPTWLTRGAAKVWEDVAPVLIRANIVQELDSYLLGQYCEAAAKYMTENRRLKKNRDEALVARWFSLMARLARDLGMSPAARTHLTVPAAEKKSKLDEFRIG